MSRVAIRVLTAINMMAGTRLYSVEEIARELGVDDSTVYRYIEDLKQCSFEVDKVDKTRFHIKSLPPSLASMSSLSFGQEEAKVLLTALSLLDDSVEMKGELRERIRSAFPVHEGDTPPLLVSPEKSQIVQVLSKAMNSSKKVILCGYTSAHSNQVKNYLVEPITFSANYEDIVAFDSGDRKTKTFKIARIGAAYPSRDNWEFLSRHHAPQVDDFRMSGENTYHVLLRMNLRSKSLLVEENPSTRQRVRKEGEYWYYEGDVRAVEGVGRFIAGLLGEVEIVMGKEVQDYVLEYVKRGLGKMHRA